jgi:hypothetical protein
MKDKFMKEKHLKTMDHPEVGKGHNKPGEGGKPKAEESGELGVFKGTRAGAKRRGDNHIAGYPDSPKEGNGHPGACHCSNCS